MRFYDGVAFWIERHGTDRFPASSVARPARRVEVSRPEILVMSCPANSLSLSEVMVCTRHQYGLSSLVMALLTASAILRST